MLLNKPILSQDELYIKYKNLMNYAIKKYQHIYSSRFDYSDLFQIAYIALNHAYEKWDPSKGSFLTIALLYINRQVKWYISKNISPFSHASRDYVDLSDITFVEFDSERDVGVRDIQSKINEIIEIAAKEAKSKKQFIYWYRRYILDYSVSDISLKEGISRSRVHKLISDLNGKIKKVYFETE